MNKNKIQKVIRKRITRKDREAQNEAIKSEQDDNLLEVDETPLITDERDIKIISDDNLKDLTLAELAELALPYSNRSIETLKRLKRDELYYIILNKKDDYKAKEYSNLSQDTKDVIELFIELLNDYKKRRKGRELNALLIKILRKQDKKINESLIKIGASGGIISYSLLLFVLVSCFIDAFIDFNDLIEKIKKKPQNVEQQPQQKA